MVAAVSACLLSGGCICLKVHSPLPPQPLVIVSQGKESDELLNVFKGKFIVSNFTFQVGVGVTWRQVNMNMFSFA